MPSADHRHRLSPEPRSEPRLILSVGLGLIALCSLWGWWRQAPPGFRQQPVPVSQAQAWMLESLPSIGPITAPQALERLQTEGVAGLPQAAQPMAQRLFVDDRLTAQLPSTQDITAR